MISFFMALSMVTQQSDTAAVSTVPDGMTAGYLDDGAVLVPIAIEAQHGRYATCLSDESFGPSRRMPPDRAQYRQQVEIAITKCAQVRSTEEAAAKVILRRSSEYADAAAADLAVKASFDAAEKMQRDLPEIMDATREKMSARR